MRFSEKVRIWCTPRPYPYNEAVDEFLRTMIDSGELLGFRPFRAVVKMDGKVYSVDTSLYPSEDLCGIYRVKGVEPDEEDALYTGKSPSRKTQIKFWEWLEKLAPLRIADGEVVIPVDSLCLSDVDDRIQKEISNGQER